MWTSLVNRPDRFDWIVLLEGLAPHFRPQKIVIRERGNFPTRTVEQLGGTQRTCT
jgi:hypothetical protein